MQLDVRDETLARIRAAAEKAGFTDLEEYLLSLIPKGEVKEEPKGKPTPNALTGSDPESIAAWHRAFDAVHARQTSHNPNVDDSREAIYGDR